MMKKPKMVVTSIQRQLQNMKCPKYDDLREHLDKAQDLYARLNDIGATVTQTEFLDIILASLLPSYELVMNVLTTLPEEVGKLWKLRILSESSNPNMTDVKLCLL